MKISILTPSYNQGKYIEKNIESVLCQNYSNYEHIVVDGGSKDNTVNILKKYNHLKWISDKDRGQADALNKAFKMSSGEIIGWINSDDYYECRIFEKVNRIFTNSPGCLWIIGNQTYYYEEENIYVPKKSIPISYLALLRNMDIVSQQPTFFRREVIERAGGWNVLMHMLMDYDLWVRIVKIQRPKMVDINFAYFTIQRDQKTGNPRNTRRQLKELYGILKREGALWPNFLRLFIKKYWFLFKLFVKSGFTNYNTTIPLSQRKRAIR